MFFATASFSSFITPHSSRAPASVKAGCTSSDLAITPNLQNNADPAYLDSTPPAPLPLPQLTMKSATEPTTETQ